MRRILIIGATSAIAEATGRLFAADGDRLFLIGRDSQRLDAVAADYRIRGAAQVDCGVMHATEYDRHDALIREAADKLGGLDVVLLAYGTLCDQKASQASYDKTREELEVNLLSYISLLTLLANSLEQQGSGMIVAISSVAGDRGRQSNYIYGTAKAALSTFLQGLRNRLARSNVRVLTVKPGFTDTPMTAEFNKGLLWAQPAATAKRIYKSINRKRDVVYVPWFWRPVMLAIKAIPERWFKRLRL